MILYFLKKYFDDKEDLIIPIKPLKIDTPIDELDALFNGKNFKADYKILNSEVRKLGYNIPPLVNAYMNLSPTMKLFGTAINYGFGEVEETGILISVDEIFEEKRIRHIESFADEHPESLEFTSGANHVIYKEKQGGVIFFVNNSFYLYENGRESLKRRFSIFLYYTLKSFNKVNE